MPPQQRSLLQWTNALDGRLFALPPGSRFVGSRNELVTLLLDQRGHPFPEFLPQVVERERRVFHHVVQGSRGQHFLVGCHCGDDGHCLERMDDIGKSLAPALRIAVCPDGKNNGPVKQGTVQIIVCHNYISCTFKSVS